MSVQMKHKHALPAIHVVKRALMTSGAAWGQQKAVGEQPPVCSHLDDSVCSTAEANPRKKALGKCIGWDCRRGRYLQRNGNDLSVW